MFYYNYYRLNKVLKIQFTFSESLELNQTAVVKKNSNTTVFKFNKKQ